MKHLGSLSPCGCRCCRLLSGRSWRRRNEKCKSLLFKVGGVGKHKKVVPLKKWVIISNGKDGGEEAAGGVRFSPFELEVVVVAANNRDGPVE